MFVTVAFRGGRRGLPGKNLLNLRSLERTYKTHTIDWKPIKTKHAGGNLGVYEKTTTKRIFLGIMFLMPIATFCMGTWQWKRLKWKTNLISSCEDRLTYSPLALPSTIDPEVVKDFEYRRVLVTGKFDYPQEMFVGPRLRNDKKGYLIVCPFIRSDGGKPILVERGWISDDKVVPSKRGLHHLSMPEGEITIECLLRNVPTRSSLEVQHEHGSRVFHTIDLRVMSEQSGSLPIYAQAVYDMRDHPEYVVGEPVEDKASGWSFWNSAKPETQKKEKPAKKEIIDSSAEFSPLQFIKAGVPIGKVPVVDFRNNHLQYLFTWYGLCFASTILLTLALRQKPTGGMQDKLKHANRWR